MAGIIGSPYRVAPIVFDEGFDATTCLSVVARWGDEVLAVAHLAPGERFALMPSAVSPSQEPHALVHPDVTELRTLAEHTADGRCVVLGHPDPLVGDAPVTHVVGAIAFTARRVPIAETPPRELLDSGGRYVLAVAAGLLVAALALAVMSWRSPPHPALTSANEEGQRRLLQALSARWREGTVRPARMAVPDRTDAEVRAMFPRRRCYCLGPGLGYAAHDLDMSHRQAPQSCFPQVESLDPQTPPRFDCRVLRLGRWVPERALSLQTAQILDERRTYPPQSFQVWRRPDGTLRTLASTPVDPHTRGFLRELRAIGFGSASRGEEIRCRLR